MNEQTCEVSGAWEDLSVNSPVCVGMFVCSFVCDGPFFSQATLLFVSVSLCVPLCVTVLFSEQTC